MTCGGRSAPGRRRPARLTLPIIGKSLGHTVPSTTAIYVRLDLEEVRESVAAATAAMTAAGKKGKDK